MIWTLVRSIYGRSSIEVTHFVLIHLQTWLPQAIPVLDWSISKNFLIWNCFAKMNRYLVGSTYGKFCIKFPQSRMKGERHSWASSYFWQICRRCSTRSSRRNHRLLAHFENPVYVSISYSLKINETNLPFINR
jgi:hypothetical protein